MHIHIMTMMDPTTMLIAERVKHQKNHFFFLSLCQLIYVVYDHNSYFCVDKVVLSVSKISANALGPEAKKLSSNIKTTTYLSYNLFIKFMFMR